jgi:hypothetical protein
MHDPNAPKFSFLSYQLRSRMLVKAVVFPGLVLAIYLWATR